MKFEITYFRNQAYSKFVYSFIEPTAFANGL